MMKFLPWAGRGVALNLLLGFLSAFLNAELQAAVRETSNTSPARIVQSYALTSTHDYWLHDPKAWRLLGSNDGGETWSLLDIQTNQTFLGRDYRYVFNITNHSAYSCYRLQVDQSNWQDTNAFGPYTSVQLAEVEFIGPVVGVENESDLHAVITASQAHPLMGPAESAFDGDLTTRWVDFGLAHRKQCWIQCQYGRSVENVVTSIADVHNRLRLASIRDRLSERGPAIVNKLLTPSENVPRFLVGYAITSGNDNPSRDPKDWRLLGSHDGGTTWKILDHRRNEIFASRFQRRVFVLDKPAVESAFRIQIDAVAITNGTVQVAEFEPLYSPRDTGTNCSMVVSSHSENPPLESTDMAFDDDARTKWFSFTDVTAGKPGWLQWQYITAEEGLPVINRFQLDHYSNKAGAILSNLSTRATSPERTVTGYSLTSANDFQARDPADWALLGSNDGGKTWKTLDARANEIFEKRFEKRTFLLPQPASGSLFRLQVNRVQAPGAKESVAVQLADMDLIFGDSHSTGSFSTVVSARGDYPPKEGIEKLFDHDPSTKWLDFGSSGDTNKSTWVQWQYLLSDTQTILKSDMLSAARTSRPFPARVMLNGVVVSWNSSSNLLGFLDASGFQIFHLTTLPQNLRVGTAAALTGQFQISRSWPNVLAPRLSMLPALPEKREIDPNAVWHENDRFALGSVSGRAESVSVGSEYTTIRVKGTGDTNSVLVHVFNERQVPLNPGLECRFTIRGVIEPATAENGSRVAGTIWAADYDAIEIASPSEEEWVSWPVTPIRNLSPSNAAPGQLVVLRGTFGGSQAQGCFLISDGTNRITAYSKSSAPKIGAPVECAGILAEEHGSPVLKMAFLRGCSVESPLSASSKMTTVDEDHPATQISQINQIYSHPFRKEFPVRIRGVITYIDFGLGYFYMQSGQDSLLVNGQTSAGLSPLLKQEGSLVELTGIATEDGVYPSEFVKFLGKGRMPEPLRRSLEYLMTGESDGHWVEVDGIISAVEKERLTLLTPGGKMVVWLNEIDRTMRDHLLGSLVKIRGVASSVLNSRSQRIGIRLLVPSADNVEVVAAAPSDDFDLPTSPIGALLRDGPSGAGLAVRLVKTKGIVTYTAARRLFIQDEDQGLCIIPRHDIEAQPGDIVEAIGLAQPDGLSPKLVQAVIHITGHTNLPPPEAMDLLGAELDSEAGSRDATRGVTDATFLGHSINGLNHVLQFQHDQTKKIFYAFIPVAGDALPLLPAGSRVRLQGVFKAETDAVPDFGQVISSFEVYMNSPRDMTILARPSWWSTRHTLGLLGTAGAVLLLSLGWVGSLRKQVKLQTLQLSREIDEHKQTEAELQAEIAERKRVQLEVERTHKELVTASRQAGMAEVATNVLHNVGNVLNSVNISSSIIAESVQGSKVGKVASIVELIKNNAANLGEFFTNNPKGRQIPGYLEKLSDHLQSEQAQLIEEVSSLQKNVEHIKEIVATQQRYAKASGVYDKVNIVNMLEDAVRMNANSLGRKSVHVARQYASKDVEITVDKHKLLQILVNLIRNAKDACDESNREDRRLTLVVDKISERVRITISDNGVGILTENLTRIFSHGFTTRKNGHGFGLHSCALAAKELGGTLNVQSDGLGKGASFSIDLPTLPPGHN